MKKIFIGRLGEKIAEEFLKEKGFVIIEKNFRTRFAEIDLIVQKENKLCFVEVKTRIGKAKGMPYEAVDKRKINHLKMASQYYLLKNPYKESKLSIDVISIVLTDDLRVEKLQYFEGII